MSRSIRTGTVLIAFIITCLALQLSGCDEDAVSSETPMLVVEPTVISATTTVKHAPINQVTNISLGVSGDGSITYQAYKRSTVGWITTGIGADSRDTVNGKLPDPDTLIWIHISVGALGTGEYVDTVWIVSSEAGNSPQIIEVSLLILSRMAVDPRGLFFLGVRGMVPPESQVVALTTEYGAQADFNLSSSSSWLDFAPQSGSAPEDVTVSIDHTGMTAGLYLDTIRISAPQASADIMVPCTLKVSNWEQLEHTSQQELRAITFVDDLHGWIVGDVGGFNLSGYIIATVDGGDTWVEQDLDQLDHMLGDIQFLDAQTGYAVGRKGSVVKTVDGGLNWVKQPTPDTLNLESVHFADAGTGWSVGRDGYLIHTVDGGATWVAQDPGTSNYLRGVQSAGADSAWIVGNGGLILFTDDGGDTWTPQDNPAHLDLNNVKFVDNLTGWVLGLGGTILYTNDAGENWTSLSVPFDGAVYDMSVAPSGKAWAVGSEGAILTSEDGLTWSLLPTEVSADLHGVYLHSDTHGWAVGDAGTILRTFVGGE